MSNIIAGVVRGQIPYLDEHIAQKKAIYERYREGLKDLPVTVNPFDEENSAPNYWLSCALIDESAMAPMVRGQNARAAVAARAAYTVYTRTARRLPGSSLSCRSKSKANKR